tara:strand:+ start:14580 stop:15512 length:933 start_codon:yes stop_codon:yes gene_type:complete
MEPRGGTELQMEMLYKHCPKELLDKVQICTSIPGKVPIDPNKLNILWQKNSYDQSNLQEFFGNPFKHPDYDWYVFNSHWNYEKFRMAFNIPQNKSIVIKNGCTNFPERKPYIKGQPIKIIHHSTPWRGLNVLLAAMQLVKNPLITLDVYSSTKVYGSEFSQVHEATYQPLFDQAKSLTNVNYIGYVPNEQILEKITDYQMFVYPSIFEETFCISALECMSAGLHVITTNFGALFETCSEWPVYVNYDSDVENLARATAHAIETAAAYLHEQSLQEHLAEQQKFYKRFYSWKKKGSEWENFLRGALNAKGL